jgi:hypothetical protein
MWLTGNLHFLRFLPFKSESGAGEKELSPVTEGLPFLI